MATKRTRKKKPPKRLEPDARVTQSQDELFLSLSVALTGFDRPELEEAAETEAEGDEVLEGLEESVLTEITQIRTALKRMQEGTYGDCVQCGEPIAEKRLEAIPHATLCITCASGSR